MRVADAEAGQLAPHATVAAQADHAPTYNEGDCVRCCDDTIFHSIYNFFIFGPYFNVAEEEGESLKSVSMNPHAAELNKMSGRVTAERFEPSAPPAPSDSQQAHTTDGFIPAQYPSILPNQPGSSNNEYPLIVPVASQTSKAPHQMVPPVAASIGRSSRAPGTATDPETLILQKLAVLRTTNAVSAPQLLDLPFEPPKFYMYLLELLAGTGIVAQYIITMLLSLMVAQATVNKVQDSTAGMPQLIQAILIFYPFLTMSLLLLANAEITVRKYMYYRLMSLGVVMDFNDQPMFKSWFMWYFLSSWVVLNVWTIYAAVVSRHDRSSPAITSWAIVNLQTGLMFNFYRIRCLTTEELLITVNNFIERAPTCAKAIIEHCDVLRERDVARALLGVMRDIWSPLAHCQDVVFDLVRIRATKKVEVGFRRRRTTHDRHQEQQQEDRQDAGCAGSVCGWLHSVAERTLVRHLYASCFIFLVVTKKLLMSRHAVWPYKGDIPYFVALWFTSLVCFAGILGVEAYGLYLAFGRETAEAGMYGSQECHDCFGKLYQSAYSCGRHGVCAPEGARTAYCLGNDIALGMYKWNGSTLAGVQGQCAGKVGAAFGEFVPGKVHP